MKQKSLIGICTAIAVIHVLLILVYGMQKEAFHEDEYYTYFTSAGYENISPYGAISEKSGYDLQRQFLVTDEHRFDFKAVIHNQELDVHPPLYYLTLNIIMSIFANQFYKWFGIGLNAIYSLISCMGVIFFFCHVDKSKYRHILAGLAGLAYAVCPAVISNVMFTRMYAMSAMWTVLYADVFVALMHSGRCSRRKFVCLTACGALVCYLSFLTHYFCVLMAFFLTLGYCLSVLTKRKEIIRMLIYGAAQGAAIGLAMLTYPACISHIFDGYRGEDAVGGLFGADMFARLKMFAGIINKNFFANLMPYMLVLLAAALVAGFFLAVKHRRKGIPPTADYASIAICLTAGALSVWILSKMALYVGDASSRYFYPVLSFMIPLAVYCICKAGAGICGEFLLYRLIGLAAGAAAALAPSVVGFVQGNVLFLYPEKKASVEFSRENAQYPLVVVYNSDMRYRAWYVANEFWAYDKIVYVNNQEEDTVLENEALQTAEKLIVYMDCSIEIVERMVEQNEKLSTYTMVRHDPFFYVYVLE